jgi:uncharacterized membrane protein YfcA
MTIKKKDNLNPIALDLLSNGSLIGIAIGTLVSNIIHESTTGIVVGVVLLIVGIISMKNNWYLVKLEDNGDNDDKDL